MSGSPAAAALAGRTGDRCPSWCFGNSVASLLMPHRAVSEQDLRDAATYLEVLADRLAAAGVPVHPHLEAEWFDFLHRGIKDYQRRVRNHTPDVVIVQFGLNEMQPWIVPVWLIRHLLVRSRAVTRAARAYRGRVAAPLWREFRRLRRRAAPQVGTRTWQTTPAALRRPPRGPDPDDPAQSRPLVLVLDINPPGDVVEHFLPGTRERHAVFQRAIADAVTSFDSDDVRLVRSSRVCADLGPEALPDGMHLSAGAHRALGAHLAEEILAWLRRGARLTRPPAASRPSHSASAGQRVQPLDAAGAVRRVERHLGAGLPVPLGDAPGERRGDTGVAGPAHQSLQPARPGRHAHVANSAAGAPPGRRSAGRPGERACRVVTELVGEEHQQPAAVEALSHRLQPRQVPAAAQVTEREVAAASRTRPGAPPGAAPGRRPGARPRAPRCSTSATRSRATGSRSTTSRRASGTAAASRSSATSSYR